MYRIGPDDDDARLESRVKAFLTFVVMSVVAAMGIFIGYGMAGGRDKCDAQAYVERCETMRQHAIVNSDSEALTRAVVLTVDYIQQTRTPGFHGELP